MRNNCTLLRTVKNPITSQGQVNIKECSRIKQLPDYTINGIFF